MASVYDCSSDEMPPIKKLSKGNLENGDEHNDAFDMDVRSVLNRFMEQASILLAETQTLE